MVIKDRWNQINLLTSYVRPLAYFRPELVQSQTAKVFLNGNKTSAYNFHCHFHTNLQLFSACPGLLVRGAHYSSTGHEFDSSS